MLTVIQGETVDIVCQVRDGNGYLTNGLNPIVSIYPYGRKPGLPGVNLEDDAIVYQDDPGAATKYGQYTYSYLTAADAQVGEWWAYFEVNVGTALVPVMFTSLIPFSVLPSSNSANAYSQDDGFDTLLNNNQYVIEIRGIKEVGAAVGSVGIEDESWFTSRYTPMYATYDQVLSSVGSIVGDVDADTVNYLIYRYSKIVEAMVFNMPRENGTQKWLDYVKMEYVIINSSIDLIENISLALGAPKSKQLGDLKVEWADNAAALKVKIEQMRKRDEDLHRILHSNGNLSYGASLNAGMAIKGYMGADYPAFGRSIDNMPRFAPSVNVKTRLPGSYRYYPDYAYQNRYRYRYIYRNINGNWPDTGS
jgi:hypothetical protein